LAVNAPPGRRAAAAALGATHVVDPADGDPVEQVRELESGRAVAAGPDPDPPRGRPRLSGYQAPISDLVSMDLVNISRSTAASSSVSIRRSPSRSRSSWSGSEEW
jgi:hypothetical protein